MRRDKVIDSLAHEVEIRCLNPEGMGYTVDGDNYVLHGALTLGLGPEVTFLRLSGDARGEEQLP
jgi:hypothetical protein